MAPAADPHGVGAFTVAEVDTQGGHVGDAARSGDQRGDLGLVGGVSGVGEPVHVGDPTQRVEAVAPRPHESSLAVDVAGVAHCRNPGHERHVPGGVETHQVSEPLYLHQPVEGTVDRVDANAVQVRIRGVPVNRDREDLGVPAGVYVELFDRMANPRGAHHLDQRRERRTIKRFDLYWFRIGGRARWRCGNGDRRDVRLGISPIGVGSEDLERMDPVGQPDQRFFQGIGVRVGTVCGPAPQGRTPSQNV